MSTPINIGLVGFGSVGSGVYHSLQQPQNNHLNVKKIIVKNPSKARTISADNFSFDVKEILFDTSISIVVEVIDDAVAAYEIVKKALLFGKDVVTANKKMLASHLPELVAIAQKENRILLYEASVCGSIPIIRTLDSFYALDQIHSVRAIANGTCNYILTRLHQDNVSFEEVLEQAQRHGFAESDPTLDIDAWDATYKLQILIYHAFGKWVPTSHIARFGIRHIKTEDIEFVEAHKKKVKLLVQVKETDGEFSAFVLPQLINEDDFLHEVSFEYNGIEIEASFAEKQLYKGKGAGSIPTASAILSDIHAVTKQQAYTYPKTASTHSTECSTTAELRIYVSANKVEKIDALPWVKIEKTHTSALNNYCIGIVLLKDLVAFQQQTNIDFFVLKL